MGIVGIDLLFPGEREPEPLVVTSLSDGQFSIQGARANFIVIDETDKFIMSHPKVVDNHDGSYTVHTEE